MTEQEWLTGTDPAAMLEWRQGGNPLREPCPLPPLSPRKLRLYACGLCRLVWNWQVCGECSGRKFSLITNDDSSEAQVDCYQCHGTGRVGGITDPRSRRAVEVSERYADGEATEQELYAADFAATEACYGLEDSPGFATAWVAHQEQFLLAAERLRSQDGAAFDRQAGAVQADLLRCVAGNPFRTASLLWQMVRRCRKCRRTACEYVQGALVCPDCGPTQPMVKYKEPVDWLTPNVLSLARTAYADRDWSLLPILADALEDGGCEPDRECRSCEGRGTHLGSGPDRGNPTCAECRGTGRIPGPGTDLLAHLRGPGPHCRGCWVVDMILGKG